MWLLIIIITHEQYHMDALNLKCKVIHTIKVKRRVVTSYHGVLHWPVSEWANFCSDSSSHSLQLPVLWFQPRPSLLWPPTGQHTCPLGMEPQISCPRHFTCPVKMHIGNQMPGNLPPPGTPLMSSHYPLPTLPSRELKNKMSLFMNMSLRTLEGREFGCQSQRNNICKH